jgi:PhzF family phenazine biosynthesis protein
LPVEIQFHQGQLKGVQMGQQPAVFGATIDNTADLAIALSISRSELHNDLRPQVVSTGVAHLLVPVRNLAVINRIHPNSELLLRTLKIVGAQGCYVFTLETIEPDATAHARFFNPTAGISEDPATGSAAGPLGCYLISYKVAGLNEKIVVEQGYSMGRPGRINVHVQADKVQISGTAVTSADGILYI